MATKIQKKIILYGQSLKNMYLCQTFLISNNNHDKKGKICAHS
jgi:hypothetical protein